MRESAEVLVKCKVSVVLVTGKESLQILIQVTKVKLH